MLYQRDCFFSKSFHTFSMSSEIMWPWLLFDSESTMYCSFLYKVFFYKSCQEFRAGSIVFPRSIDLVTLVNPFPGILNCAGFSTYTDFWPYFYLQKMYFWPHLILFVLSLCNSNINWSWSSAGQYIITCFTFHGLKLDRHGCLLQRVLSAWIYI